LFSAAGWRREHVHPRLQTLPTVKALSKTGVRAKDSNVGDNFLKRSANLFLNG
jgi:hypothetical protein